MVGGAYPKLVSVLPQVEQCHHVCVFLAVADAVQHALGISAPLADFEYRCKLLIAIITAEIPCLKVIKEIADPVSFVDVLALIWYDD